MLRRTLIVGGVLALMVGPVAMAQPAGSAAQSGGFSADMLALRQNAMRLTILNSLPEDARADAAALLDRRQALRTAEQELQVARLQAYVAALESGESPAVAQDLATSKVATQSADVTREREALRADTEAFVEAHPEVRSALMQAGPFGREAGAPFRAGELGQGPGAMFGAGEFGGGNMRFGAGEFGMQRHGMQPGGAQRMQLPEWLKEHMPGMRNFQHR